MKIIGAGMSKTGTKSLNAALTILGYKVFDYFEHMEMLYEEWEQLVYGEVGTDIFKQMYKDADAAIAFPVYLFWEEIHVEFPDAKVILTVRDNEEEFVKSSSNQLTKLSTNIILFTLFSPTYRAKRRFRRAAAIHSFYVGSELFSFASFNAMLFAQAYRRHNAYVKKCCPPDQLLVFNSKEGWKPLCDFLGVPIPDVPFPHKNIKGEFYKDYSKSKSVVNARKEVSSAIASLLLVGIFGLGICYRYCSQR